MSELSLESQPSTIRVVHAGVEYSSPALRDLSAALDASLGVPPGRVAFAMADGPLYVAALLWAHQRNVRIAILPGELGVAGLPHASELNCTQLVVTVPPDAARFQAHAVEPLNGPVAADEAHPVWLCTSGTTGKPKPVGYSWQRLLASVKVSDGLHEARWMSLYPLSRFAGCNTLLHAACNGSTLIIPDSYSPQALSAAIQQYKPTHLSGTPTLWKALLMRLDRGEWTHSIQQVTAGGECVDQATLNLLHFWFPHARVTHVYATTESGVCTVVSDGLAGFPSAWLHDPSRRVELSVREGVLWVRRQSGESSEPWTNSGDQVERRGDRMYFLGRQTEILNVGGAKVAPAIVEQCISEVPGVLQVHVFGKPSSLAGTLVCAEVAAEASRDLDALRVTIMQACRATLPAYAVPRKIEFVEELAVSSSGKLIRGTL
ncbi:class I adenylate-forming enzyme family protein [Candidatus Korobacter versatilis]|nr:class I adenylate-forming enzyme family protein [Candidatus Koribacter versatilis]